MRSTLTFLAASSILAACGSGDSRPATSDEARPTAAAGGPDATAAAPKANKPEEDTSVVPTACEPKGSLCVPTPGFVKRLCGGVNPDVALAFFKKGTPFSRAYLKMNVERAWNASGGASSADRLAFDEEVIVLLSRENKTGIEVSGASGSYDVLRWDGTCATLSNEELTFDVPPRPKNAKIVWKDLSDEMQTALLNDQELAAMNKKRRDECKGATMGTVSKECVKAVDKLSEAVVAYIRAGGDVPSPARIK